MALIYRALFQRSLDTATWINAWWLAEAGALPELVDGVAVAEGRMLTRSEVTSDEGHLIETIVRDEQAQVAVRVLDWRDAHSAMVVVEEQSLGAVSSSAALRTPSALTLAIARRAERERSPFASAGEVLLVGLSEFHRELRIHLDLRLVGMVRVRTATVEYAVDRTRTGLSDGSVAFIPAGFGRPVCISSVMVRQQPGSVARRFQREALTFTQSVEIPAALREAERLVKRRSQSDEDCFRLAEVIMAERDDLEKMLKGVFEEQDQTLAELDETRRRLRYLELEFRQRGEVVPDGASEDELPIDVRDSIEALGYAQEYLRNLVLSPRADDRVGDLDAQHSCAVTAKRAWRALRALNDYVRAKLDEGFTGSFLHYCQDTPAGYDGFPPGDVAMTESQSCLDNATTRAARVFSVPEAVHSSGEVLMAAHIKVAGLGNLAARLHFYDDTAGATQKIHIGYLGPHLPLP